MIFLRHRLILADVHFFIMKFQSAPSDLLQTLSLPLEAVKLSVSICASVDLAKIWLTNPPIFWVQVAKFNELYH